MVDPPSSRPPVMSAQPEAATVERNVALSMERDRRNAPSEDRSGTRAHSPKSRRPVFGALPVLLASLVAPLVWAASWVLEPNRYAAIRSIETEATYRDPALMEAAWRLPVAERYRKQPYEYQKNPSFCGPASVADLLHSLGIARSQDAVIDGTRFQPWFGILLGGLTLDQLAELLKLRTGRPVAIERDLSLAQFRRELVALNDPERRVIANFHRGPLFGRGHGHFSPLLGYLAGRDLVLVGDVNPNYRPFLVSSARLWRAVDTIDPATGRKRGLLLMSTRCFAASGTTFDHRTCCNAQNAVFRKFSDRAFRNDRWG